MADFLVFRPAYRHHLLFPDLEPLEPPPLFPTPSASGSLKPFYRGPRYSTYAKLREWKLRQKKAGLGAVPSIPLPQKRSAVTGSIDLSMSFRKENRKPPPSTVLRSNSVLTPPPPMAPKLEHKMVGSASTGRKVERKAPPIELFSMRRSFSSFNELKGLSEEDGREKVRNKGITFRKSIVGFDRSMLMKMTG